MEDKSLNVYRDGERIGGPGVYPATEKPRSALDDIEQRMSSLQNTLERHAHILELHVDRVIGGTPQDMRPETARQAQPVTTTIMHRMTQLEEMGQRIGDQLSRLT